MALPIFVNWITWSNPIIQKIKSWSKITDPNEYPVDCQGTNLWYYPIWKILNCTMCLGFWLGCIGATTITYDIPGIILIGLITSGLSMTFEAINRKFN
jgi:hypothetical protein